MTGYSLIGISMILTLSAAYYFYAAQCPYLTLGKQARQMLRGRYLFGAATVLIGFASVLLIYLLLSNRFEYFYVFKHSSISLPLIYKVTAFWAGQEGSFLLWTGLHSLLGAGLLCQSKTPPRVMVVHCLVQALLLSILIVKTPFMLVNAPIPADGLGLNPMLQDFWMIVHPPIIFIGYAALAIPFAFALEGALSGQVSMIRAALPWSLAAWGTLGLGIFAGGFWAYKVLGWGGYWAWDPVENASLVPWLFSGAAIHLMVHALARPAGVRFAYLSMVLSFILVIYGTLIARSGIMADFSTHSFPDEGLGLVLSFILVVVLVLSMSILIAKWPQFDSGPLWDKFASRDFLLTIAAALLILETAVVFCGMSLPLVTSAIGQPQQVNSEYYNLSSLPVALAIMLGVCLQTLKARSARTPSFVIHIGIGIMIFGIFVSSAYSQSFSASVQNGDQLTAFGREIQYAGKTSTNAQGYTNIFRIDADTATVPVFSQTKINADGSPNVTEPAIQRGLLADLYIAPSVGNADWQEVSIAVGEQISKGYLQVQFLGFKMSENIRENQPGVRALLSVTLDGKTDQCAPALYRKGNGFASSPETVFDRYTIQLVAVEAKEKKIVIGITDLQKDMVIVDISLKPLVSFVWIGCFLISVGTFWSVSYKVRQELKNDRRF